MIKSAKEFVELRTSDNPDDYRRSAHESATTEIWLEIIENYPQMREWVVLNKTVPLEVLELLVNDSNEDVRFAIAMKNKLNEKLFEILARDKSSTVRHKLVYNKNIPKYLLIELSQDSSQMVKQSAINKLEST